MATTSWEVLTATSSSLSIDGAYTDLFPTPDLEGVGVTVIVAQITNPVVFAQTTLLISFTPNSNLPSNALIDIGFPEEFALAPTTQSCTQSAPSTKTLSCTYTTSGGYITKVTINNP